MGPTPRCLFVQTEMGAVVMVIRDELQEESLEMALVQRDDLIEQLAPAACASSKPRALLKSAICKEGAVRHSDKILAYDLHTPTRLRLDDLPYPLPRGSPARKPGSPAAITGPLHETTSPSTVDCAQAVLDHVATTLVRLEATAHTGYSEDGSGLASSRLPLVLDVDLKNKTSGRQEACEPGRAGRDLPYGG